jgi:surface protein
MPDYSIDLHHKTKIVITDEYYQYTIKSGEDSADLIIYVESINPDIQKAHPINIKVPSDISYNIVLDRCFIYHRELIDITALAELDASKVISMYGMFHCCNHLADITPISTWDVSSVTNMDSLFSRCLSLKNIMVLSNWTVLEDCDIRRFYTIPDVSLEELYRYIFPNVNDINETILDEEVRSGSRTVWVEDVVPYRRRIYQNEYVKNNCPSWLVERYMKVHTLHDHSMEYDYEHNSDKYLNELGDWLFNNYKYMIDFLIYNWDYD